MQKIIRIATDWRNLLLGLSLILLVGWIFSRIQMVNPAILGDEYLYSLNARQVHPWGISPVGDFSNYLFNFVYSSTNICGEAFYTCGKVLNLVFFSAFLIVFFIISRRFLSFWIAYSVTLAVGLSPLSVYTSMFLPETMYFFGLSVVFLLTLRAANDFNFRPWFFVGVALGVTSLVKPHAWISAIAIGIFIVVIGVTNGNYRFRLLLKSASGFALGAIVARIILGFLVGGPKAINFFGSYVTPATVEDLTTGSYSSGNASSPVGTSQLNGLLTLFFPQLNIHLITVASLMGISVVALVIGIFNLVKSKTLDLVSSASLLLFIWLATFVVSIVMFTGLITGGGDDHTTRVLERYYDFLFAFIPLVGLSVFVQKQKNQTPLWLRVPLALFLLSFITPAFSGFFGTLTIQIADAPNLAGLVVEQNVFNAAAFVGIASVVVFAFFPKYVVYVFALMLPVTMVGTGWQIQDQYQGFRGSLNAQDRAGQFIRSNFTEEQRAQFFIVGNSRFEVTNVAIWADSVSAKYEMYAPGSILDESLIPEGLSWIVTTGDVTYEGAYSEVIRDEGFAIYRVR